MDFDKDAAYFYHCDNETVHGLEFQKPPMPPHGMPLVADMTSSLFSKRINVDAYDVIFAGA